MVNKTKIINQTILTENNIRNVYLFKLLSHFILYISCFIHLSYIQKVVYCT